MYIEKVAKILGVEMHQDLKVVGEDGQMFEETFFFEPDGFFFAGPATGGRVEKAPNVLFMALNGKNEIVNFPHKGGKYHYPNFASPTGVSYRVWRDDQIDYSIRERVGVYLAEAAARAKAHKLGWVE